MNGRSLLFCLLAFAAAACDADLGLSPAQFACGAGGPCSDGGLAAAPSNPLPVTPQDDAGTAAPSTVPTDDASSARPSDAGEAPAMPPACAADSPAAWRRIPAANALARTQHSAVLVGDDMIVFGGAPDGNDVASLRLIDSSTAFRPVLPDNHGPSTRSAQTAVYDPIDPEMVVVGGRSAAGVDLGDAWFLALNPSHPFDWSTSFPGPSALSALAGVAVPSRGHMYMFGGCSGQTPTNVTYSLSLGVVNVSATVDVASPPPARCGHTMSYDERRDQIVLFGGRGLSGTNSEVWIFSPGSSAWSQLAVAGEAPPGRGDHVAVIDPTRDRLIVFGGRQMTGGGTTVLGDVWALSLVQDNPCWIRLSPTGSDAPGPRYGHSAVFHQGRLVIYGGENTAPLDDVWELSF